MSRPSDKLQALLNSGDIDGFEARLSAADIALVSRAEFSDLIPQMSLISDDERRAAVTNRLFDLAATAQERPSLLDPETVRRLVQAESRHHPTEPGDVALLLAKAVAGGGKPEAMISFMEPHEGDPDEALKIKDLALVADMVRSMGPGRADVATSLLPDRDDSYVARLAAAVGNSALAEKMRASQAFQPAPATDRPRGPSMAGPR